MAKTGIFVYVDVLKSSNRYVTGVGKTLWGLVTFVDSFCKAVLLDFFFLKQAM